jgi:hypothetical protein
MIDEPVTPDTEPSPRISLDRRGVLAALGAAGLLPIAASGAPASAPASAPAAVRAPFTSSFLQLDPAETFRQVMRLQRSLLDADDILHWYHFVMYAVPAGGRTVPVVRWEGIELSRHQRIGELRYRMHGHNLSYPRDLDTGAFIDAVLNPVSGEKVPIAPMRLTQDPGLVRSPAGTITLDRAGAPPRRDYRVLRREGDWVKVDTIRVPPATWPQPFIEGGYEGALAADFDDPRQLWLRTQVSGAYVFPWPAWMQMGDRPGHMLGIWSGHKLRSVAELPDEFRRRAEREDAALLEVDRALFRKAVPDLHGS